VKLPDFFIVGAPKCGTTALASYLRAHPRIFLSPVKEPNYFCFDAPGLRVIDRPANYGRLFAAALPEQLCGEASTAYLFSNAAVPAILDANPAARIIVSVRDPLEMVLSHHSQKVYSFEENEPDFETAWRLSAERASGRRVAADCRAPRYLDYRAIGRLGEQVQRLKTLVPQSQLHAIVFDDLRADPGAVYRATLAFLGVAADGQDAFPVVNARKTNAWPALARLLKRPPAPIRRLKLAAKRAFPAQTKAIGSVVHGLNQRPEQRRPLAAPLRREMAAAFKDDVSLLGELLNRDLSHWCQAERA
jgi:Sulfotransferase domain